MTTFTQSQAEAIARALGDTNEGLTGTEISHLLATVGLLDDGQESTKWKRLYNAFASYQNAAKDRAKILAFMRKAMKPERFVHCRDRFEPLRSNLNRALSFAGLQMDASGKISPVLRAETIAEAQRRANDLRNDLAARGVHADVLACCRAELVDQNYFHAVLEATKSVAEKLRVRTGLTDDGGALVDHALSGDVPMLAVNSLSTESERSEQRGFANLIKGAFGMFRNPTAHAPKVSWQMSKQDAEDLLSLASLVHRRLDAATMPQRVP